MPHARDRTFLLALLLGLVLFIPLIVYQNLILSVYILPSAQALGIWGRVTQFFELAWLFFDMGTSTAFVEQRYPGVLRQPPLVLPAALLRLAVPGRAAPGRGRPLPTVALAGLIWQGDQLTSVLIFFLGILPSFPVFMFFHGLFGGWDAGTLEELRRSVDLSGFARPLAWPFWASTALGARISPLHDRFPMEVRAEALQEAAELTSKRISL